MNEPVPGLAARRDRQAAEVPALFVLLEPLSPDEPDVEPDFDESEPEPEEPEPEPESEPEDDDEEEESDEDELLPSLLDGESEDFEDAAAAPEEELRLSLR